ncbi:MAG: TlpA disulfide reductase family protein [Candidatus Electrothrix sp. YB6]
MHETKKIKILLLPIVVLVLLLAAAGTASSSSMPSFTLPSAVDGKDISSEDFKDKVLLITFFATWCPPCHDEIPSLIQLQNELGEKGFSVLALSLDEGGPKIVRDLVKEKNINYPVAMANSDVVSDFGGLTGIPTSFLISSEGKMMRSYAGYVAHDLLRQDIEEIMPKEAKEKKKEEEEKKKKKNKKSEEKKKEEKK